MAKLLENELINIETGVLILQTPVGELKQAGSTIRLALCRNASPIIEIETDEGKYTVSFPWNKLTQYAMKKINELENRELMKDE